MLAATWCSLPLPSLSPSSSQYILGLHHCHLPIPPHCITHTHWLTKVCSLRVLKSCCRACIQMQIEIRYRFRGCCYHLASLVHEYNTKTKIIHTWDNFTTKRDRNTRTQNTSKHKIQGWRLRFSFLFSFTYFLVFALALTFAALSLSRSALTKQTHSYTHTRTEMARSLAISFSLSRPRVSYIHMLLRLRACVCAGVCMYGFYDDEKCLLLLHRNQVFCSRFSHFFNN